MCCCPLRCGRAGAVPSAGGLAQSVPCAGALAGHRPAGCAPAGTTARQRSRAAARASRPARARACQWRSTAGWRQTRPGGCCEESGNWPPSQWPASTMAAPTACRWWMLVFSSAPSTAPGLMLFRYLGLGAFSDNPIQIRAPVFNWEIA